NVRTDQAARYIRLTVCSNMAMRAALSLLLLVYSIRAEYTMTVYQGFKNIALENFGAVPSGPLAVGADYSLEIKNTDLTHDYLIESCTVVETGEQIIGPPGCLKCTNVFINMVESAGYGQAGAVSKSSIIHFRPNRPDISFSCKLLMYPPSSMDRACALGFGAHRVLPVALDTHWVNWGTGGLPWWAWLLIILLLLLLLCCCLALLAFLFFKWRKKSKNAVTSTTEKTVVACTDVKPMCVVRGTQTSNFDRTSINRMALENGSEVLMVDRAASKQSDIECARVGATSDEKVEVFSGHAGVYNVRNGTAHRFEKNPNITRTRHESELFEEVDRHSYFNQGYEPEHRRSVNCVEGYDEVVRYTSDREIGEYDHVEREIETNHTTRFYNEPVPTTRYYDRRHLSIPV
ncbi:hypothetical protein PENTCL1PPCAC_28860, partial [Pristionchus entomophagus]